MASITVYDGATSIGGNKIFVQENNRGVFLDFGKNFGAYGTFYEEFLKNRDTRGINDQISLGLIPKLNIYRPDLIPHDVSTKSWPSLPVEAVLLSHAHMDHCGNISLLRKDIPILSSPVSLTIIKALQDTANASVESDILFHTPRVEENNNFILKSEKGGKGEMIGRNVYITSPVTEGFTEFIYTSTKKTKNIKPGSCFSYQKANLPFDIYSYPVDHSVPGSQAYVLHGDTTIAYTGDIRLHGGAKKSSEHFAKSVKDASVLISEGTRVASGEGCSCSSEASVHEKCRETIDDTDVLVVADFSPRNVERLDTFRKIATKCGRDLVITAKDAYLLQSLEKADGVDRLQKSRIYCELMDRTQRSWEKPMQDLLSDIYVPHEDIRDNPGGFILAFSFFDLKNLLDIRPDNGIWIYSSCEPFNEEMEIDFKRLSEWLRFLNFEPYGFSWENGPDGLACTFNPEYHASGHASADDLRWIIETIDPDVLIPVHTTNHQWFTDNFEQTKIMKNAETYAC